MASNYFIQKGDQTFGPMSSSDLMTLAYSGKLASADLVWKEGSEKKVRADQVKGLTFKSPQDVTPSPVQDDVPSSQKDNVSLVENEPDNSKDQREFHYEINGEGQDPVSFTELQELVRQRVVTKETQVWHDGLDDWTPASEINELAASFPVPKKTPPPLKKSPPPLPKKASPPLKAATSQTSNDPVPTADFQIQTEPVAVPSDVSEFHVREQVERKSSKRRTVTISKRWSSLSLQSKICAGCVVLLLFLLIPLSGSFSKQCPRCEESVTSDVDKKSIKESGMCVDCAWNKMEREVRREGDKLLRDINRRYPN